MPDPFFILTTVSHMPGAMGSSATSASEGMPNPLANVGETNQSSGIHLFEKVELFHITSAGISVVTIVIGLAVAAILYKCCTCKPPRWMRPRENQPELPVYFAGGQNPNVVFPQLPFLHPPSAAQSLPLLTAPPPPPPWSPSPQPSASITEVPARGSLDP